MPVRDVKTILTTTEYLEWMEYFRWDDRRRRTIDYYLAQIADAVERTDPHLKRTRRAKVESKLLKFKDESATTRAEAAHKSKMAWASFLGLKIDK